MSPASRFALGTALAVACVALLGGGALALASTVFTRTDHRSRVIRGDVSRVVVATRTGDVSVRPGGAGSVRVDETRRFWLRKPQLDVALRNGVLAIKVDCGTFGPACSDDLDVVVPAGVARTRVSADSGDVEVSGMRGTIDLSTSSGDVDADAIAGDITMSADSGDVTASAIRAGTVSASADSGDVTVTLLAPARVVQADADSGDVTVDLPGGRYAVDAGADSGDVGVDGVIRDDTAPRHVEAHADSGDVTVRGR